jgi:hypothetical protein
MNDPQPVTTPAEMRRRLIDLAGLLISWEVAEGIIVGHPRAFFSVGAEEFPLAPERPAFEHALWNAASTRDELFEAALTFWADTEALSSEQLDAVRAIRARRDDLAEHPSTLIIESSAPLLEASMRLRELSQIANRWWVVEIEAAAQPEILAGEDPDTVEISSLADVVLGVVQSALHGED